MNDRPKARTEGILVEPVADEAVLYDLDTSVAHALKPLAAAVFAHADGSNGLGEIAEACSERLGSVVTESDVSDALSQLEALNLLEETEGGGVSRRDAIKVFAAAGAGSVLISSVAAPAALAGGTGGSLPGGCHTGNNVPTSSNCVTNVPGYSGYGKHQTTTYYNCPLPNTSNCYTPKPTDNGHCWSNPGCPSPTYVNCSGTCTYSPGSGKPGWPGYKAPTYGQWKCVQVNCGGESTDHCQVVCVPDNCGINCYDWGPGTDYDLNTCKPSAPSGPSGYWGVYCSSKP